MASWRNPFEERRAPWRELPRREDLRRETLRGEKSSMETGAPKSYLLGEQISREDLDLARFILKRDYY
jgi:hypothetical protein